MTRLTRRIFLAGSAGLAGVPSLAVVRSAGAQSPAPRRGGTLRISVDQAASVIHPLRTRVNPEYLVTELLYSNLTRLKLDMTVEPDLAESWSANAELTEWTFRLREGLTFHDGTPCTAKDVAATFVAILDPKTASPGRTNVGPIAEATAVDARTVVFKLSAPYADLPVAVAYTNARIIPAAIAQGDLDRLARSAVGTGPFRLVSYEPDRRIVVERNPAYYDPQRPWVDRVEVLVYPDPTAEASALLSGDTDVMMNTAAGEFPRLSAAAGVKALRVPSGQFLNVNMGCDQKPFSDVRVRQALALTVDREAMVGFVAGGFGTPGNDSAMNAAYHFYKDQPLKKPDIAKAKRLLAEAGYPNGLDLTMVASDTPGTRAQLAVAMREMGKAAGFRINVQTMPHATYLDQVWKKGAFYVGFYNMQATADAIFSLLYTSNAAWNETRWNNADFDKLVAEARVTLDEARRQNLYGQAQMLMHEQVPSVIPAFFDLLAAQRAYVQGRQLHPRGAVFRLDHVWLGDGAPKRG
ncbi:ABC transporter substrate-binding protein [Limobrevibacterium gyesilva]|uniref:ABC transporter substrate-binding protein n=1 Tax=Limobrevibacterium gyesilva TaxID=2991712 RepID=A0AA41YPD0_9PROT|nr:ABC transporter substrate-binding protein [Limobrevibacterium gyesilva]MCW3476062.1 ABC transporter substrate-binding protein [Limobrevibacterium gyesilva]